MFIREGGNWTKFRELGTYLEVDFHFNDGNKYNEYDELGNVSEDCMPYWEKMGLVYENTLDALKKAQDEGIQYVIFTHGHSTSRPGQTTARSVVRSIMRSKESTPYIVKKSSIQHYSVFASKIKPK